MNIKKIIIGISGSIAAYKTIHLIKLLLEQDFIVNIVLSKSAPDFISVMTLKSLFPQSVYLFNDSLNEKDEMLHISLAKSADLILIAPCSANMIANLANGNANCLLSTICLTTKAQIAIAPAMNKNIWGNSIVQFNVAKLQQNGIKIFGPASGKQACGDNGLGRMLEPEEILEHVKSINIPNLLKNKKVIITAGPTREQIDPVRFLSNYSSGKMGYALAKIAFFMGAKVTLISGPTYLPKPYGVEFISVESTEQMFEASMNKIPKADIFISSAAIADYSPASYEKEKIKKTSETISLTLKRNIDVIASLKEKFPNVFYVGFAAETDNFIEYGRQKMKNKKLNMIVVNDVSNGKVFGQNDNEVHVLTENGNDVFIKQNNKNIIAQNILEIVAKIL